MQERHGTRHHAAAARLEAATLHQLVAFAQSLDERRDSPKS